MSLPPSHLRAWTVNPCYGKRHRCHGIGLSSIPLCLISACFCIFCTYVSFLSHPPSGTNARHWALLSPRPHPRVPCQNPICWQVHTCIYFLCNHCFGLLFSFIFIVLVHSDALNYIYTVYKKNSCFLHLSIQNKCYSDISVSQVSKRKVLYHSRISGWLLCWAEDTLAR